MLGRRILKITAVYVYSVDITQSVAIFSIRWKNYHFYDVGIGMRAPSNRDEKEIKVGVFEIGKCTFFLANIKLKGCISIGVCCSSDRNECTNGVKISESNIVYQKGWNCII